MIIRFYGFCRSTFHFRFCLASLVSTRNQLFNPNLSGLFRGSFLGWGDYPTCQKLVRDMLETLNLVRKYTHICSFNIPSSPKALLILLMSACFCKNSTFTQSYSVRAVLEIF